VATGYLLNSAGFQSKSEITPDVLAVTHSLRALLTRLADAGARSALFGGAGFAAAPCPSCQRLCKKPGASRLARCIVCRVLARPFRYFRPRLALPAKSF
jgi:hypothetical protein